MMVSRHRGHLTGFLMAACLLLSRRSDAQEGTHVAWPLIDFLVSGDSVSGVELLASPNMVSRQGGDLEMNEMAFDPALARQWTAAVVRGLDSVNRSQKPAQLKVIAALRDRRETGVLAVGYDPSGLRGERFFLFWDDSTAHHIWRAAASSQNVFALIDAVDAMAVRSAVRVDSTPHPDSTARLSEVQVRPELLSHPALVYPFEALQFGAEGRVWLEVVVDSLGRPEMPGARVLFSDGKDFSREALRVLAHSVFRPARVGGKAVRVWIRIPFCFRRSHP